jgi:hypothetical protein
MSSACVPGVPRYLAQASAAVSSLSHGIVRGIDIGGERPISPHPVSLSVPAVRQRYALRNKVCIRVLQTQPNFLGATMNHDRMPSLRQGRT